MGKGKKQIQFFVQAASEIAECSTRGEVDDIFLQVSNFINSEAKQMPQNTELKHIISESLIPRDRVEFISKWVVNDTNIGRYRPYGGQNHCIHEGEVPRGELDNVLQGKFSQGTRATSELTCCLYGCATRDDYWDGVNENEYQIIENLFAYSLSNQTVDQNLKKLAIVLMLAVHISRSHLIDNKDYDSFRELLGYLDRVTRIDKIASTLWSYMDVGFVNGAINAPFTFVIEKPIGVYIDDDYACGLVSPKPSAINSPILMLPLKDAGFVFGISKVLNPSHNLPLFSHYWGGNHLSIFEPLADVGEYGEPRLYVFNHKDSGNTTYDTWVDGDFVESFDSNLTEVVRGYGHVLEEYRSDGLGLRLPFVISKEKEKLWSEYGNLCITDGICNYPFLNSPEHVCNKSDWEPRN